MRPRTDTGWDSPVCMASSKALAVTAVGFASKYQVRSVSPSIRHGSAGEPGRYPPDKAAPFDKLSSTDVTDVAAPPELVTCTARMDCVNPWLRSDSTCS